MADILIGYVECVDGACHYCYMPSPRVVIRRAASALIAGGAVMAAGLAGWSGNPTELQVWMLMLAGALGAMASALGDNDGKKNDWSICHTADRGASGHRIRRQLDRAAYRLP
ncbi:hypothetical protein [Catenuloplanes atrovinosus]|uniref:Uncharacterized protein n=1 Tax=Catenuloplanes atrovinosus TaxID=137266 RepID=A0AAE3YT95_9ACTN|nr:hypothetical protein [Catenuloplanes atrovinosus]MDR7279503.1 hypothetical protein [Catenuloplanes atrovinosus]